MCKIRDDIEIVLESDKTTTATAIRLLAKMVDNRLSEQDKKFDKILNNFEKLDTISFLSTHKWVLWLAAAGFIYLIINGSIDTVKLFLE